MMAEDAVEKSEDLLENELIEDHFSWDRNERHQSLTFDDIAIKLLRENLLLSALELHTELTESGQELPRLRDYFSNPGNFEKQAQIKPELSSGLPRTSSVQTFDSLDFTRYSDDGEKQVDERVAVLEFELRKAKETIKFLRTNLTFAAESESNTPDANVDHVLVDDAIKPHEQRALNFLVNEYLLKHKYKLTSITFADENEEQDFEDWDDVGLNISKPPDLLCLYRDSMRHIYPHLNTHSIAVQANMEDQTVLQLQLHQSKLENEMKILKEKFESLTKEKKLLEIQLNNLKEKETTVSATSTPIPDEAISLSPVKHENEMLQNIIPFVQEGSNSATNPTTPSKSIESGADVEEIENERLHFTLSALETENEYILESAPFNDFSDHYPKMSIKLPERKSASEEFHRTLFGMCFLKKNYQENRLALEVAEIIDSNIKVVEMLGRCLPHIVPNVILAKREELIPVLLCTINLHPNAKDRDCLLNILFNLIKRPDDEQRQMILCGFATIAQQMGPTRIEEELLPQCWEQIGHKYTERRLLVAESCGVLAPYVPSEIRSSLVLSMLQQMLQDKSELVREAVIKSLAIVFAFINEEDKFSQGFEMLLIALYDTSEKIVLTASKVLLPVFAAWASDLNRLETDMIMRIVQNLERHVKRLSLESSPPIASINDAHVILILGSTLCSLLPWLFLSTLRNGPFVQNISECNNAKCEIETPRYSIINSPLEDINIIVGDRNYVNNLIAAYEIFINEEWYEPWEKFDWLSQSLLPQLIDIARILPPAYNQTVNNLAKFFRNLGLLFGSKFVSTKLKPLFQSVLISTNDETNNPVLTTSVVSVYSLGILSVFFKEEDRKELITFLQDLLIKLCIHHLPLDGLRSIIHELSSDTVTYDLLLTVLWSGVVDSSSKVRCGAAQLFELLISCGNDVILASRIVPALITLASDPEITVRVATIPAFGAIIETSTQKELLDKVRMQFQTFLEDPQYEENSNILIELIRIFGQIAPNADSSFREEFVLPRLALISSEVVEEKNDLKRVNIAMALLEAFSSLSCCFLTEHAITDSVLPGLKSLLIVIQQRIPEHSSEVVGMIREFETKMEIPKQTEKSGSFVNSLSVTPSSMEDMRNKMSKIFIGAKVQGKANMPNIPNLFQLRKK